MRERKRIYPSHTQGSEDDAQTKSLSYRPDRCPMGGDSTLGAATEGQTRPSPPSRYSIGREIRDIGGNDASLARAAGVRPIASATGYRVQFWLVEPVSAVEQGLRVPE